MEEHQEVLDRLRALGSVPVESELGGRTLAAMRAADAGSGRLRRRVLVGVAALVTVFGGSVGLASAGALPAGLQDRAQSVLDRVGVEVPPGHLRYNDPTVCPGGPYKNHGQYVSSHKDDPNAGSSPCGKPIQSVNGSQSGDDGQTPEAPETDQSPPANPGRGHGNGKPNDKGGDDDESTTTISNTSTTA